MEIIDFCLTTSPLGKSVFVMSRNVSDKKTTALLDTFCSLKKEEKQIK